MNEPTITAATVSGIEALRIRGPMGVSVTVSTSMGPRILELAGPDGRNVLAELPNERISLPGIPEYRMLGGHRLWHTPEVPSITYRPDESAVTVAPVAGGLELTGAQDPVQGVRKRLRVTVEGSVVRVEHQIRNVGAAPLVTAAWAITQVPPAGEAWVPLTVGPVESSYLPNRSIVLWPYSSVADERLDIGDDLAIVRGVAGSAGRVKIGTQRRRGWIAWRDGGALLVIEAAEETGSFGDMGAATQCYSCGDFVELETVGPLARLEPAESTVHTQTWRLLDVDPAASARDVIASLGLEAGP